MYITLDDVQLDDQLQWVNEFDHDAVAQTQERSITGALLVQHGVKLHGREIELRSNGGVWTPLSVVRQLEAMRDEPGRIMQLTLADGRQFHVIFNRSNGAPLTAEPLFREAYPTPDSDYLINLRLLTVAPPPEPEPDPEP
ncbi:hypothetical protein [Pseudomonas sp. gcc21]|uniref:hypothetical protein n=1 Tax=Pseudomonas sp. gcc21 TaxID=2726989 RepID=UPI002114DA73|nr:hypothetical protein [Pseudomonas sp. gcc21]